MMQINLRSYHIKTDKTTQEKNHVVINVSDNLDDNDYVITE